MRNEDRERTVIEVVTRIVEAKMQAAQKEQGSPIIQVINDTIYHEKQRLKKDSSATAKARAEDTAFWNKISRSLPHANDRELKEMLSDITTRFVKEVSGNFNSKVYDFSVRVLPVGLSFLLNAFSPRQFVQNLPQLPSLDNNILLSGQTEELKSLAQKGTVVLLPTHLSNLDSPVIGWSIYKLGLPPFTYGAGLNLFKNRMLSFFMQNLGAYKVDRRKKARLYKEVLKGYSTNVLEQGNHSLFFPGGTRTRSGMVERQIKKGLLGTALNAYIYNLQNNNPKPNIYFVPCTINYHLVLEAKTLVEDYLKDSGRSRYIIEDDEFSDLSKIFQFTTNLTTLNSQIHMVFGQAFDAFGNRVSADGRSFDQRDREVDITRYVLRKGEYVFDSQRDNEYTNELSHRIVDEFSKTNMIMVTHLTAYAYFDLLQKKNRGMDLYRLLHTGGDIAQLPIHEMHKAIDQLMAKLRKLEADDKISLEPWLRGQNSERILERALRLFKSYHQSPVLHLQGERITSKELNLLYYYQNRLDGYPIKDKSS